MSKDLLSTLTRTLKGNLDSLAHKLNEVKNDLQEKLEKGLQKMEKEITTVNQNLFGEDIKQDIPSGIREVSNNTEEDINSQSDSFTGYNENQTEISDYSAMTITE